MSARVPNVGLVCDLPVPDKALPGRFSFSVFATLVYYLRSCTVSSLRLSFFATSQLGHLEAYIGHPAHRIFLGHHNRMLWCMLMPSPSKLDVWRFWDMVTACPDCGRRIVSSRDLRTVSQGVTINTATKTTAVKQYHACA